MDLTTLIGSAAALCSTVSFAPQAWKIIRSRSTDGLSPGMYGVTVVGFALWLAYGIRLGEWPLMITNGICLLFSGFILVMIMLPRGKTETVAATLDPTQGPEQDGNAGETPGA